MADRFRAPPQKPGFDYDTTAYARSNEGHWWTSRDTLSESEVEDMLAYLKTL